MIRASNENPFKQYIYPAFVFVVAFASSCATGIGFACGVNISLISAAAALFLYCVMLMYTFCKDRITRSELELPSLAIGFCIIILDLIINLDVYLETSSSYYCFEQEVRWIAGYMIVTQVGSSSGWAGAPGWVGDLRPVDFTAFSPVFAVSLAFLIVLVAVPVIVNAVSSGELETHKIYKLCGCLMLLVVSGAMLIYAAGGRVMLLQ